MKFKGTRNFLVKELEASDTARRLKIDNTIPDEYEYNTKRLLSFLQGMREAWGSGIRITSGYRSEKLNKVVKGSKTSAHTTCNAVDLWPCNNKFSEFTKFVKEYLKDKSWDQCIIESSISASGKITRWLHLGLYNNSGRQRRQIFNLDV